MKIMVLAKNKSRATLFQATRLSPSIVSSSETRGLVSQRVWLCLSFQDKHLLHKRQIKFTSYHFHLKISEKPKTEEGSP
jgi:hypothetical protein